jgi:hypothetical protein
VYFVSLVLKHSTICVVQALLPAMASIHLDSVVQTTVDSVKEHVQSLGHGHEHQGAGHHHHGIDMQHPEVALSAAVVSIGVKEGYVRLGSGSSITCYNATHSHCLLPT